MELLIIEDRALRNILSAHVEILSAVLKVARKVPRAGEIIQELKAAVLPGKEVTIDDKIVVDLTLKYLEKSMKSPSSSSFTAK